MSAREYRPIPAGARVQYVEVYRNLHLGRRGGTPVYSVRHAGKVIGHAHWVLLLDATCRARRAGWERAYASGRKEVYATIEGVLVGWGEASSPHYEPPDALRDATGAEMRPTGAARPPVATPRDRESTGSLPCPHWTLKWGPDGSLLRPLLGARAVHLGAAATLYGPLRLGPPVALDIPAGAR
ncbi:hypothetical protein UFOVP411_34 [uncultured Caudovirales phage]|uniref:Uncharacterized protein n=1 Tax=uncultured Caudovirales phage TaxID=2100421 RepID=A0A6J5M6E7_9CAUD|nr:hypothetical protein UFOVP411_34 [uncultured Caudovirales phage]